MNTRADIIDGPVPRGYAFVPDMDAGASSAAGAFGAELTFDGVVRADEHGRSLSALRYEVYQPMAQRQLSELARQIVRAHSLLFLGVVHSRGVVPVGERSLRVIIRSRHRAETLAGMGEFIDRLKHDVPIWKSPIWRG
ncbi:MAG: molybdenum cofactor biosynthesis protein MoaE [Phycisphaerales bacterium]